MTIYALGSNGAGQLGLGHEDDVCEPQRASIGLTGMKPPAQIRAGGNHTLTLTTDHKLYISGMSTELEELGLEGQSKNKVSRFRLVATNVQLCSATWEATMVVQDDQVFSHGKGDRGELGRPESEKSALKNIVFLRHSSETLSENNQILSETLPFIVDLASGVQHTVAVLKNGQAWGWGNGRKGQLGECGSDYISQPHMVQHLNFKVVRAVCGREFTFLVSDPLEGRFCVLGSDKWGVRSRAPASVSGWTDIGACWGSIFVLLKTGQVISWGRNDHGQLAPKNLPTITKIACGSEHCLGLTQRGTVLVWGWGEHGNCGPNTDFEHDVKNGWAEFSIPDAQDQSPIIGIGAGCATSWFWTATADESETYHQSNRPRT